MSSVTFSLKNAINRVNNPTSDGLFAYGKYTQANAFTLFTDYEYTDGTPLVLPDFDDTKVLAWKGAAEFPHLGFENIQGNTNITPQPFPDYGIYLHPFYSSQRDDVGVRFTCPITANITILSKLQKKDQDCGDGIGYRILKNGGEAQTRQVYPQTDTPHNITTNISVSQGDIIDFIVDVGDNSNSFCDDVALEVEITVNYDKLSAPIVTTTEINCSSVEIEGFGYFIPVNTVAVLRNGDVPIAYAPVSLIGSDYRSFFKFIGLDLSNFSGKPLNIVFQNPLIQESLPVSVTVDDSESCFSFKKPVITSINPCKKKYRRLSNYTVTSDKRCLVAIANHRTKEIVGSGYAIALTGGGSWAFECVGEERKTKEELIVIAIPFGYKTISELPSITLVKSCNGLGTVAYTVSGYVNNFTKGILVAYPSSVGENAMPIGTAPINNGEFVFYVYSDMTLGDYVFYAIELDF